MGKWLEELNRVLEDENFNTLYDKTDKTDNTYQETRLPGADHKFIKIKSILDCACIGLKVTPKELYMWLDSDDIDEILVGTLTIDALKLVAKDLENLKLHNL